VDEIETAAQSLIAVPDYFKRFLTECGEMEQCLKPVDLPGRARAKEGVPSR
jgi:hypothetical protein